MEQLLRQGLTALGISTDGVPALLRYSELLLEKNKVMNLTAITEPKEVATLHFLDCAALLTAADFSGGRSVADVGTGAGFPGLVLKILCPDLRLTLVDALGKRVDFLQEICDDLNLSDVQCVHARGEEFARTHRECFDIVTSRAVAALPLLCELDLPLVNVGGLFLAMKGTGCDEELSQAQNAIRTLGGKVNGVQDYQIPGTQVTHRFVKIDKISPTPENYPRAFAKIKKNPL